MKLLIAAIVCSSLLASNTHAMKISDYLVRKDNPQAMAQINDYLKGYVYGLFNANDLLEARQQAQLFCMENADDFLGAGNYSDLVDIIIKKNPVYVQDNATVEIALLTTLVNENPCRKSAKPARKK
jgi:hypothetical protein